MTDNTPLNADDELFGELRMLYKRRISSNLSLADYLLEMRQLILADRKKHEIQARLSEREAVSREQSKPILTTDERIAELKQELEKL